MKDKDNKMKDENIIKGLKLKLEGSQVYIAERKKPGKKPKYYLWDLDKKCYVSSLFPTDKIGIYFFDTRDTGIDYHLDTNRMKIDRISEQGKRVS